MNKLAILKKKKKKKKKKNINQKLNIHGETRKTRLAGSIPPSAHNDASHAERILSLITKLGEGVGGRRSTKFRNVQAGLSLVKIKDGCISHSIHAESHTLMALL